MLFAVTKCCSSKVKKEEQVKCGTCFVFCSHRKKINSKKKLLEKKITEPKNTYLM